MRIYIDADMDTTPGSAFRSLLDNTLGPTWPDYMYVEMKQCEIREGPLAGEKKWLLHCEDGPAAVKTNWESEFYLEGKKLPVQNHKEFQSYMRNKAFW